ncbi:hypothetical protein U6B65_14950 (plasmid) [Oscillospiraceae bacterium MB08-C2-2]|nr:hypothetical protein U6B65_14950 [Oscillospiraceae bacterium MB08-C2-2]
MRVNLENQSKASEIERLKQQNKRWIVLALTATAANVFLYFN